MSETCVIIERLVLHARLQGSNQTTVRIDCVCKVAILIFSLEFYFEERDTHTFDGLGISLSPLPILVYNFNHDLTEPGLLLSNQFQPTL